jgi:hypothetical protein
MGTMGCKAIGSDAIRQTLKAYFLISSIINVGRRLTKPKFALGASHSLSASTGPSNNSKGRVRGLAEIGLNDPSDRSQIRIAR